MIIILVSYIGGFSHCFPIYQNKTQFVPMDPKNQLNKTHFEPVDPKNQLNKTHFEPLDPKNQLNKTQFEPGDPKNQLNKTQFEPVDPKKQLNKTQFEPVDPKKQLKRLCNHQKWVPELALKNTNCTDEDPGLCGTAICCNKRCYNTHENNPQFQLARFKCQGTLYVVLFITQIRLLLLGTILFLQTLPFVG
jgi:hypothetical protein